MKIYRVSSRRPDTEHVGYFYYTNKYSALRTQRELNKETENNDEVEVFDIPLTKNGVMKLLRLTASHPDNGSESE